MSRVRPGTRRRVQDALGEACLAWTPDADDTALRGYVERHGVAHLLERGRMDAAEQRMLDLFFMAAFADAWKTVVEPLRAWRRVGLERARDGFVRVAEGLPVGGEDEALEDAVASVGGFLGGAGLYAAGSSMAEWVLESMERTLGPEHPHTLASVGSLANHYRVQGRYTDAEPLFLRALEARERTLGPEHPHTLTSVGNLAVLYKSQGRYAEAQPLYLRVLEARERTLGTEHPSTLTSVNNLATLYESLGRTDEAQPLFLRVLEARERTLGPDHPKTLISVNNLAWLRLEHGPLIPRDGFARLLTSWTDRKDWKHHWARLGLALCTLKEAGDATEAEAVLADLTALLGADHDRVAKGRERLAQVAAAHAGQAGDPS